MSIEYRIAGGKLVFEKAAFARELLLPNSPLKTILGFSVLDSQAKKRMIVRTDDLVTVDYNFLADILLDENFMDLFEGLKSKLKEKMKGSISIRMGFYTSYFINLNFNSDDGKLVRA
ncbi:hypothetical protein SDC9_147617 [bioreactor metagenome]|uniref:Uncharacterized protein n=1 Tax=bioreactor metagenome TaxID=1076179 RepID=A0A645EGL8_9ZZZZ